MRWAAVSVLLVFSLTIMMFSPARAGMAWPAAGLPVATGTGDQDQPLVIGDGLGGCIIIWQDHDSASEILYAQRLNRWGQSLWSSGGVRLTTTDSDQRYPTAVSDGFGGCLVFWQDDRGTYSQIYGQRLLLTGARNWGNGALLLDGDTADQTEPAAVMDGSGGAVVVWRDWRNDSGSGDVDLYAKRVNSSGSAVYTGVRTLLSNSLDPEGDPVAAGDGSGGVFVGWASDQTDQNNNNVYAQFIDASGAVQWGLFGTSVCQAVGMQGFVAVAPDNVNGMWLAWEDQRDATTAVYLQRLNSSGVALFTVGGVRISHSARSSITPAMVSDGNGGVFVAYPTGDMKLYYRHASPGVGMLVDNDQPVFIGAGHMGWDAPVPMAPDGRNGCFVAWPDDRTGTTRMYAQQLSYAGPPRFPAAGVPLTSVDNSQSYASLAVTETGRAVCAWRDNRDYGTSELDVYAQSLAQRAASQTALPLLLNK